MLNRKDNFILYAKISILQNLKMLYRKCNFFKILKQTLVF